MEAVVAAAVATEVVEVVAVITGNPEAVVDVSNAAKKATFHANVLMPHRAVNLIQSVINVARSATFPASVPKEALINVSNVVRKATFPEIVLRAEAINVLIVMAKATFQGIVRKRGK